MSSRFSTRRRSKRSRAVVRRGGQTQRFVMSGYQRYPAPLRLPPTRRYRMQLRNVVNITSNGSGVISGAIPCDPSVTLSATFQSVAMFTEWTSLAGLFSLVRCIQLECTFLPLSLDEVKGDVNGSLSISSNLQVASAPGSYGLTDDNTDSQLYPFTGDTSGRGRYHAVRHRPTLTFMVVGTPSSSTIYSGCPGSIGIFCNPVAASTIYMSVQIVGTYEFMSRS